MKRRDLLFASSGVALAPLWMQASTTLAAAPTSTGEVSGEMVTLAGDLKGYYSRLAGAGFVPAVIVQMEAFGLKIM